MRSLSFSIDRHTEMVALKAGSSAIKPSLDALSLMIRSEALPTSLELAALAPNNR